MESQDHRIASKSSHFLRRIASFGSAESISYFLESAIPKYLVISVCLSACPSVPVSKIEIIFYIERFYLLDCTKIGMKLFCYYFLFSTMTVTNFEYLICL